MLTPAEMKTRSEAAARRQAELGGDRVHEVTLVTEPSAVAGRSWVIRVRLVMSDGNIKAFECESTDDEVYSVREVTPG